MPGATEFVRGQLSRIARSNGGLWKQEVAAVMGTSHEALEAGREHLDDMIAWSVVQERRPLAVRLQIAKENLYQSYDRKRAEGEFRGRVSLPLTVLVIAVAASTNQPAVAVLMVVPAVLAYQGFRREQEAEAELVELLTQGVIFSPLLERLAEAASDRKARQEDVTPAAMKAELDAGQLLVRPDGSPARGEYIEIYRPAEEGAGRTEMIWFPDAD